MKIDYNEILKEAIAQKISVHLIAKRKLNYKKKDNIRSKKYCGTCREKSIVTFPGKKTEIQCNVIGIDNDPFANIKATCVCDAWTNK